MKYPPNSVYISGNARVGENNPISFTYKKFFVSVIIDGDTHTIVEASCNSILQMTVGFLNDLLVNRHIIDDYNDMLLGISNRYFGSSQRAIIAAVKDVHNQYCMLKGFKAS